MRALITGGAGFIGSHLSDALLDAGHQVLVLDNLSTGSFENISHLKGRSGFEYHIDSVNNEPLLAEFLQLFPEDGSPGDVSDGAPAPMRMVLDMPPTAPVRRAGNSWRVQ